MRSQALPPRRRRAGLTLGIALCAAWLSAGVAAAEPPGAPSRVVARVFGTEVRARDISPSEGAQSAARKQRSASDYETWLRDYRKARLEARVWREATDRLLEERGLAPTAAEVEALATYLGVRGARRLDEFRTRRQEIRKKLSSGDLTPRERAQLEQQLAQVEKAIAFEQKERERSASIPNYEKIQLRSRRRVAKITIRNWKANKALYETYGGRVIFQQAGFEPVDAYRAFIAELEKRKAVEILDPSLTDPFSRLVRYLDMPHLYMPKAEADKYFKEPWWLADREGSAK